MKKLLLLSAISLACIPALGYTQQSNNEAETLVLSDSLSYDDKEKISVFKGNVILTRGLMRLTADELHLKEDASGAQQGKAIMNSNNKVIIYEERPESYEVIRAEGNSATYDGSTGVVRLIGQSIVTRSVCGKVVDTLRGDIVTYNNKTNTYAADGDANAPDRGRVRSVIQARPKVDEARAECHKRYNGQPMPSSFKTDN